MKPVLDLRRSRGFRNGDESFCFQPSDEVLASSVVKGNSYLYVKNNPVNFVDPSGLWPGAPSVEWKDVERVYTVSDYIENPLPGRAHRRPKGSLAATIPRLKIDVTCEDTCSLGEFTWVVSEIKVTFWTETYLDEKYDSDAEKGWVMRAESDHFSDFLTWTTTGLGLANDAAKGLDTSSFKSRGDCEEAAKKKVMAALMPSLEAAFNKSISDWDASGKHNYGGPNQRP